jgi:hypothetical protein
VCIPGTAPNCDDGNLCTDDHCEPDRGCVPVARTGFAGVTCELDMMDAALASVASPVHEKLAKLIMRGRLTLGAAEVAGHGRRALRPLRATGKQLKAIARVVRAARRRNKVSLEVVEALLGAADGASRALLDLRASLTR